MISLAQYAERLLQETLAAAEVDGAPRLEALRVSVMLLHVGIRCSHRPRQMSAAAAR